MPSGKNKSLMEDNNRDMTMQIRELFTKPLDRNINGVVKAEQLDEQSIWSELDEYVVTRELDRHFRVTVHRDGVDSTNSSGNG